MPLTITALDLTHREGDGDGGRGGKEERDVSEIGRLREVLSCGVCSAVGFVCVWTCLVLAAQEGYGVGRKRILLLCSLHLWLPSSFVSSQDCSWYSSLFLYLSLWVWFIFILILDVDFVSVLVLNFVSVWLSVDLNENLWVPITSFRGSDLLLVLFGILRSRSCVGIAITAMERWPAGFGIFAFLVSVCMRRVKLRSVRFI